MPRDRTQRLDPAGAAAIPPPAMPLPPASGNPAERRGFLLAEITKLGREGFDRGYSAAVDQLAEPITATWLASESGLPEDRCRELLLELRGMLVGAGGPRG